MLRSWNEWHVLSDLQCISNRSNISITKRPTAIWSAGGPATNIRGFHVWRPENVGIFGPPPPCLSAKYILFFCKLGALLDPHPAFFADVMYGSPRTAPPESDGSISLMNYSRTLEMSTKLNGLPFHHHYGHESHTTHWKHAIKSGSLHLIVEGFIHGILNDMTGPSRTAMSQLNQPKS